jgi:hypothetical protein
MKKMAVVLFLGLCSTAIYGQKTRFGQIKDDPNPADYTAKVHISASHLETNCANGLCNNVLYADAVLSGKKMQLSGIAVTVSKTLMLIAPGDYPVKLLKDVHNSDSTLFNQQYDLLLRDNLVWHCFTTGVSE